MKKKAFGINCVLRKKSGKMEYLELDLKRNF